MILDEKLELIDYVFQRKIFPSTHATFWSSICYPLQCVTTQIHTCNINRMISITKDTLYMYRCYESYTKSCTKYTKIKLSGSGDIREKHIFQKQLDLLLTVRTSESDTPTFLSSKSEVFLSFKEG